MVKLVNITHLNHINNRPDCKNYTDLIISVMTKKTPPIPYFLSDEAKDFIKVCCQFDKNLRPTAYQLLEHPFLQEQE